MSNKPKVSIEVRKMQNAARKMNAAAKKAIKPYIKNKLKKVKQDVPKDTGALKKSLSYKLLVKRGNAGAVIGPRVDFSQSEDDGTIKIPNKYCGKVNDQDHFLDNNYGQEDVKAMREILKDVVKDTLK